MEHSGQDTAAGFRVEEALASLRTKDVRSATMERLRLTWEADAEVRDLSQPLQLGRGLKSILNAISVPVCAGDLVLGRMLEEVPGSEDALLLRTRAADRWLPAWMRDVGHCCFAWDRLLRLGLRGLEELARAEVDRMDGEEESRRDFLRGAILVYQAFRGYARRYARAAERAGLGEAAANCRAVAEGPPRTFAEGLQLLWLVGLVYCSVVAPNPAIGFGRVDELLLELYRRDLREGRLGRERAGELIEDWYCKMNLVMGRGEHLMGHDVAWGSPSDTGWAWNLAYDSPLYLVLGGLRTDGKDAVNELTVLFAERVIPRFENPVVVFRYTPDVPEALLRLLCEKMRENAGIHLFNDAAIVPAMVHAGIAVEDAVTYTMHGCNEPDIPGKQKMIGWSFDRSFWLPRYVLSALELVDEESFSIAKLYEKFRELLVVDIERACKESREERTGWDAAAPGILRVDDCFHDGPISRGRSWELGGVEYQNLFFSFCSLATAADSFAAVEALVEEGRAVPLRELRNALRDNFAGRERLRQQCVGAPKFGRDDDRADRHATRILSVVTEIVDACSRFGRAEELVVFRCLYTIMGHILSGKATGATPDGRRAGEPLSENLSPSPGSCTRGLTAMLSSICKLPLDRFSTGIVNVRVHPSLVAGEGRLERLQALLRTYFARGGIQIQLTCAGTEDLRDAQANPERHRDLMVRVTGYSAAFTDMTPAAQEEIIRREVFGPQAARAAVKAVG